MSAVAVPARPATRFHALAAQLATRADQAQAQGLLILSCGLRGFAAMARDLAKPDELDRWDVADPAAIVPPALLAPDGRYSCDGCEGLVERAALVTFPQGFYCSECAQEQQP